jgi:hypothetical protein
LARGMVEYGRFEFKEPTSYESHAAQIPPKKGQNQ